MIEAQPDTADSAPPRSKAGRPKSTTIALTRRARERFDRKVAENIDALFEALFEAATEDGDVNAARLLIDRAIPSRRGAPVSFSLRPLRSPPDCAEALDDLLMAVSEGKLTPDEANLVSAIVAKRAEMFASVELAAEIEALKAQLAAVVGTQRSPTPIRRSIAIT